MVWGKFLGFRVPVCVGHSGFGIRDLGVESLAPKPENLNLTPSRYSQDPAGYPDLGKLPC